MLLISATASVRRRALLVSLLVVGLVAMHHLVTTGCSVVLGGNAAHASHTVAPSSALDHASHAHDTAASGSPVGLSATEVQPGLVVQPGVLVEPVESGHGHASGGSLAAVCLAIVMLLLVVRRPSAYRTSHHHSRRAVQLSPALVSALPAHPPDLTELSISRT